ncbi:hypothetical protein ABZ471_48310 [Streptomyces sp. NPDC005728]|uniref:hypothetical protein n=1 Tax=Streptomyces sp. NPDC005728 TaxID=3157054 RepID=UPI00340AFE9F
MKSELVGLIGTTVGGVIAVAGSVTATWLQTRRQRNLAHDERMWVRRADLYVELLTADGAEASPTRGYPSDFDVPPDPDAELRLTQLRARVDAFASTRVARLWHEGVERDQELLDAATAPGAMSDIDYERHVATLSTETTAVEQARAQLRKQIRAELDPGTR